MDISGEKNLVLAMFLSLLDMFHNIFLSMLSRFCTSTTMRTAIAIIIN
jgi:hypothetical protein